jgi:hypothetical protein
MPVAGIGFPAPAAGREIRDRYAAATRSMYPS